MAPTARPESAEPAAQKAVLVTGASTGIGRKITERLASAGYFVYAGARKDADLRELDAIENVDGVRIDVTKPGEIAAAKGRIVNIGSISGTLSGKDLAAYSMSKHAIEAYTDSLAGELAPLGVTVSVVEPGNYRSEIGNSAARRAGTTNRMADRSKYKEPDEVADAVLHALFDPNPRRRCMVVPNQSEAEITSRKQIEELVQLNGKQPYSYDRKAIVEMLDAALAAYQAAP